MGKSLEYNKQKAKHVQLRNKVEEFDKQISKSVNLKQKAFDSGDIDSAQRHQKRLEKLDGKVKVDSIKKNEPKVSFRKMGENNVHALTGDKHGQIAVDLNGGGARGPERVIFDLDSNLNPAYSDFTETHDYANKQADLFDLEDNDESYQRTLAALAQAAASKNNDYQFDPSEVSSEEIIDSDDNR